MKRLVLACTIGALTLCPVRAFSQDDEAAYRDGYDLILGQRWNEAREYFNRFGREWPESAWADDAAFWRCYAQQQQDSDQEPPFRCYEQFIADWPTSSWVADARSQLTVLSSELASRGRPEFLERQVSGRSRGTADDELLTLLAALRDNERASEILIQRFDESDDALLRGRIVLLLEEIDGADVTRKLIAITEQDESMRVRENAVIVLLDRDDTLARDRLIEILGDEAFSVSIRSEIVSEMDDWNDEQSLAILEEILTTSTELSLIEEAADALADSDSEAAIAVLLDAFDQQQTPELRYVMLEQIADVESQAVMSLLSDIALTSADAELANIAIEGIADREDSVGVAALEHIYANTDSRQRKLAALDGMGEAESEQAVEILARIIATESEAQLLAQAASALGETEQESAVAILLDLYHGSNNADVQRGAIHGLDQLSDYPAAVEGMLEILEARLDAAGAP